MILVMQRSLFVSIGNKVKIQIIEFLYHDHKSAFRLTCSNVVSASASLNATNVSPVTDVYLNEARANELVVYLHCSQCSIGHGEDFFKSSRVLLWNHKWCSDWNSGNTDNYYYKINVLRKKNC